MISRHLILGLALVFIPLSAPTYGQGNSVNRVARMDELLGLDAEQKAKIADLLQRESAAIDRLSADERPVKAFDIRQATRTQIRDVLTPPQQKLYDRTPQNRGGGLNLPTPQGKLEDLDKQVGLSPEQKKVALEVFTEEFNSLLSLSPEERPSKGMPYRRAAQDQIRALLSPDQLAKQDGRRMAAATQEAEERSAIEKALRASPKVVAAVGGIAAISPRSSSIQNNGTSRKGWSKCDVTGARSSGLFVVTWERNPSTGPVVVVTIADAQDNAVRP